MSLRGIHLVPLKKKGPVMASALSSCLMLWVPSHNSFPPCSLLSAGYSRSPVRFLSIISVCALVFLVVASKDTSSCEVAARMPSPPRLVGKNILVQSSSRSDLSVGFSQMSLVFASRGQPRVSASCGSRPPHRSPEPSLSTSASQATNLQSFCCRSGVA